MIIGGDCFDKGLSNLDFLISLRILIDLGVNVILLVGNYDLCFVFGFEVLMRKCSLLSVYMFVCMGKKVLLLLWEIYDFYVDFKCDLKYLFNEKVCLK